MLILATDVRLTTEANRTAPAIVPQATLKFLSIVETARIPCYMFLWASVQVSTSNDETQRWFSQIFASASAEDGIAWWESARPDSPLGVLVSVEQDEARKGSMNGPKVTELLIYASRSHSGAGKTTDSATV